jgi:DNA-binding PadR family transcriptional regulator
MAPWNRYEDEGRHGHRFGRGDLKFVILGLLEDHPSYGYEIMRALEDRFHGFYSPSPGTVYPTLQWLQDLGYVTVAEQDGRKTYTITDEGRRFLAARGPRVEEVRERMRSWAPPFDTKEFHQQMHDFAAEMRDMAKDLRHDARWASPDKLRRVREVVIRAGREIEDILREPEPRPDQARSQSVAGDGPGKAPGEPAGTDEGRPGWSGIDPSHGDAAMNI